MSAMLSCAVLPVPEALAATFGPGAALVAGAARALPVPPPLALPLQPPVWQLPVEGFAGLPPPADSSTRDAVFGRVLGAFSAHSRR
jgi:hypothetical protein